MKTQAEVRAAFAEYCRQYGLVLYPGRRQNSQPCDTRMAWVDYVDMLARDQEISPALAQKVTL